MFESPYQIRASFNSRLKRARLEFFAEECFRSRKPPRELLDRIEERFKSEKNDGLIETYMIFAKRFEELWSHIRAHEGDIDPKKEIKFTIGQGGRVYSEIQVTRLASPGGVQLSCAISPKKMSTIPFNAFLFNVLSKLDAEDYPVAIDRAQMRFLYLMLKNGQALRDVTIVAQPKAEECPGRGFLVRINPQLHAATLHVFNSEWLSSAAHCKQLLQAARSELDKINTQGLAMTFLEDHSREKIASLGHKMQAFGFNLPYDLLIAYDERYRLNADHLGSDKAIGDRDRESITSKKTRNNLRRVRGEFFQIDIDPSGMKAVMATVDEKIARIRNQIDEKWLVRELARLDIHYGFEAQLPGLVTALRKPEPMVGLLVAKGQPAAPGENAALTLMSDLAPPLHEQLDMRERQNRLMVHSGELVAEVRYTDGAPGTTIEGVMFYGPASAEKLGLKAGEGMRLERDCQFYATRDGLLRVDEGIVSCQSIYVHKGSVNLSSGNLRFDGAVVVEGDIESGASVDIRGTLIVKGSIGSAKVKCTGDLEVKGGVNTGKRGFVQVGGQASLGFVENSVLQVKLGLTVEKSISHSWIIAGGLIQVRAEKGLVVGGLICSWQALVTARFGTEQGHVTQCRIGSHYQDEVRLQRLSQRMARFQEASEDNHRSISLLSQPGARLSAEQLKHLEYIQKNAQRFEAILGKLKTEKTRLSASLTYNPDATLVVTDIIDKNTQVWMCGKKIPVTTNMKGVLIASFAPKGIVDLAEIDLLTRSHPLAHFGLAK